MRFKTSAVKSSSVEKYYSTSICNDESSISSSATDGKWGDWGPMHYCPTGWFVMGVRLWYQEYQGKGNEDDTALNVVAMRCYRRNINPSSAAYSYIWSKEGPYGTAGSVYSCSGKDNPVVGFRLQTETTGCGDDCVGANNIQLRCKNGQILRPRVENDWGSWSDWVLCPSGKAVVAMQARVEEDQGTPNRERSAKEADDTTLNGVRLICNKYDF